MSTDAADTNEVDYEDLTTMRLDDDALQQLVDGGGECVFNWTTREGYPVGVVVAETEARLVVAFDTAKFQTFTNQAIQVGLAQ
jgi:hypothetical protein